MKGDVEVTRFNATTEDALGEGLVAHLPSGLEGTCYLVGGFNFFD